MVNDAPPAIEWHISKAVDGGLVSLHLHAVQIHAETHQ
jgi:hypothetical protein